jgi:hypothetical protein
LVFGAPFHCWAEGSETVGQGGIAALRTSLALASQHDLDQAPDGWSVVIRKKPGICAGRVISNSRIAANLQTQPIGALVRGVSGQSYAATLRLRSEADAIAKRAEQFNQPKERLMAVKRGKWP